MYCVVYEFIVDEEQEEEFKSLWNQLTLCIRNESGSLGSRLHKALELENTWVAYAQWPSHEIYSDSRQHITYEEVRQQFLQTCKGIRIVYQMDLEDDLLLQKN